MTTTTTTIPAPVELPVVDSPLDPEVANGLGDEVLLHAAASEKVQKVRRGDGRRNVSPEPRAWTSRGNVD